MARNNEKLDWNTVDVKSLPDTCIDLWDEYQEVNDKVREARAKLEQALNKQLVEEGQVPDGQEPVWAYRFGKLALAFREEGSSTSTSAKGMFAFKGSKATKGRTKRK